MRSAASWIALFLFVFGAASPALAQKLRRPYAPALAFNYGFDNKSGGGCTDWNCGTVCYDGHTGVDHPTPLGTDVLAGAVGRVTGVNNGCANYGSYGNTCGGRCGNYVQITHDDGTVTIYCHMKLDSLTVSNGQRVDCGQKIGQSASSGSSTGPHLHVGWRPAGSSTDIFRGSCTSSPGGWNQQNGYRDPVGVDCVNTCQPSAEVCDGKDNDCDGKADEDDVCDVAWLDGHTGQYAPARTTDVNGDGKADVCGRGGAGFWCHLANGAGFDLEPRTQLITMASADGWAYAQHYATLRMGDLDGDGRADLCARAARGVVCWASDGGGGWARFDGPALSNDSGWSAPQHYTTLRLADINGDGKDDLCARAGAGLLCWPSTGRGFGDAINGPPWSNDAGYGQSPRFYGTLRFGDINGDGKDDACIRNSDGYLCAPSNGTGFDAPITVAPWGDAQGWDRIQYWATIQLADVNGDGKDDVCARSGSDLRCAISRGTSFGDALIVAELSDALGWDDPSNWGTLRVGDLNDDGRDDLCVRSNAGVRCWAWDGGRFNPLSGPAWRDDDGWSAAERYATLRMGDVDGDGMDDLCARAPSGWTCHVSTGTGFDVTALPTLDEFKSASGWEREEHWSSMQLGGPRCSPERCNGRDDDCDGLVDDDAAEAGQQCDPGTADPCELGLTACVGGLVRCEAMRVERPDCGPLLEDMGVPDDMSLPDRPDQGDGGGDMSAEPDEPREPPNNVSATGEIGCACGVAPRPRTPTPLWLLLPLAITLGRRKRR